MNIQNSWNQEKNTQNGSIIISFFYWAFLRFGKGKQRVKFKSDTPAPGKYQTRGKIEKEGPKYHMANKTSMGKFKNMNPGPAAYNPYKNLVDMKDKPKYTFGLKMDSMRNKKKVPGPGTY